MRWQPWTKVAQNSNLAHTLPVPFPHSANLTSESKLIKLPALQNSNLFTDLYFPDNLFTSA